MTKRIFMDYLSSMLRFETEARRLLADGRTWQGETILLATRGDKDTFKSLEPLSKLYPNATRHVFEDGGGHHMVFLFPEEYARVLSQHLT